MKHPNFKFKKTYVINLLLGSKASEFVNFLESYFKLAQKNTKYIYLFENLDVENEFPTKTLKNNCSIFYKSLNYVVLKVWENKVIL